MELAGFVSVGALVVIQLVAFAYGYGKLNGKVASIDKRLNDLSHLYENIEGRLGKLEGRK